MSKLLTIEIKVQFKRVRDGRKKLEEASAAPPALAPEPVPREARLMALAIHFDRLIREGAVGSYSEIARLTGACPAWITEIMKLADLPASDGGTDVQARGRERNEDDSTSTQAPGR